jgi:hypothetical protein
MFEEKPCHCITIELPYPRCNKGSGLKSSTYFTTPGRWSHRDQSSNYGIKKQLKRQQQSTLKDPRSLTSHQCLELQLLVPTHPCDPTVDHLGLQHKNNTTLPLLALDSFNTGEPLKLPSLSLNIYREFSRNEPQKTFYRYMTCTNRLPALWWQIPASLLSHNQKVNSRQQYLHSRWMEATNYRRLIVLMS